MRELEEVEMAATSQDLVRNLILVNLQKIFKVIEYSFSLIFSLRKVEWCSV